jgi:pantoate--beta-alanine ligase
MDSPLPVVRTIAELRAQVAAWRREGLKIGLTPTMGALHEGHLSLVRHIGGQTDRVVASIFVNPTQFAPHEDFDSYPRDEAGDLAKLAAAGCRLVYAPNAAEVYPEGFATQINVGPVALPFEGVARPHFFGGVATVVAKLLQQVAPDAAIFGEKDYQQLQVIRRMVRDLDMPVRILSGATMREADGLAMSSRNAYLNPDERLIAGRLNVILREAAKRAEIGGAPDQIAGEAADALRVAGFDSVDYVAIADAETLELLGHGPLDRPGRVLAAARIGKTRLIDNFPVKPAIVRATT